MKGIKVLVVDDEEALLYLYRAVFLEKGFEVFTASNGAEGLKKFHEVNPHIVLSDIDMPKMNGFELFEAVQEIDKEIVFFLYSGGVTPERKERAKEKGVSLFDKLFEQAEMLQAIETACEKIN